MRKVLAISAALALSGNMAAAQPGTVDSYTPADQAKAFRVVRAAGFTPVMVATAQDGVFSIKATKGTQVYQVTVTPDGKAYPSLPEPAPVAAPAGRGQ